MIEKQRCLWCTQDPIYQKYHDEEWGKPLHGDRALFELLLLEGFQAGLSWITILKKRDAFRLAFDNFEAAIIAAYQEEKIAQLLNNKSIIRNRLKIKASIKNAQAFLALQKKYNSFDAYIWSFTSGKSIKNHWKTVEQVPITSPISDLMSKSLKQNGFSFVGSTICYSFMQAAGIVQDHTSDCFCYNP